MTKHVSMHNLTAHHLSCVQARGVWKAWTLWCGVPRRSTTSTPSSGSGCWGVSTSWTSWWRSSPMSSSHAKRCPTPPGRPRKRQRRRKKPGPPLESRPGRNRSRPLWTTTGWCPWLTLPWRLSAAPTCASRGCHGGCSCWAASWARTLTRSSSSWRSSSMASPPPPPSCPSSASCKGSWPISSCRRRSSTSCSMGVRGWLGGGSNPPPPPRWTPLPPLPAATPPTPWCRKTPAKPGRAAGRSQYRPLPPTPRPTGRTASWGDTQHAAVSVTVPWWVLHPPPRRRRSSHQGVIKRRPGGTAFLLQERKGRVQWGTWWPTPHPGLPARWPVRHPSYESIWLPPPTTRLAAFPTQKIWSWIWKWTKECAASRRSVPARSRWWFWTGGRSKLPPAPSCPSSRAPAGSAAALVTIGSGGCMTTLPPRPPGRQLCQTRRRSTTRQSRSPWAAMTTWTSTLHPAPPMKSLCLSSQRWRSRPKVLPATRSAVVSLFAFFCSVLLRR